MKNRLGRSMLEPIFRGEDGGELGDPTLDPDVVVAAMSDVAGHQTSFRAEVSRGI